MEGKPHPWLKMSAFNLFLMTTIVANIVVWTVLLSSKYNITEEECVFDFRIPHAAYRFENARITTVMDKLREWYSVDYCFAPPINQRASGIIPKDMSFDEALELIAKIYDVRFERVENTVVINPLEY